MTTFIQKNGGVTVRVTVEDSDLAHIMRPGGQVDRYTYGKTQRVAVVARQLAPVKTGKLRAGIRVEQARNALGRFQVGWQVVSTAPYSAYVTGGTRPHQILPTNGKLLRFMVGGQVVFARKVNHPGTRANPFMEKALVRVMGGSR